MASHTHQFLCEVCHQKFPQNQVYPIELIRDSIVRFLSSSNQELNSRGYICLQDYHKIRKDYMESLLIEEKGDLSEAEKDVLHSLQSQELVVENTNETLEEVISVGQRMADKISAFGGSWTFITFFLLFLVGWMILNSYFLLSESYDPYPYILLNLILSCMAAIQAPIIMMSQNRRAERDRIQAENDYKVNLTAELQIRLMNQKLERFMNTQWYKLLEIQKMQTELMEDLSATLQEPTPPSLQGEKKE